MIACRPAGSHTRVQEHRREGPQRRQDLRCQVQGPLSTHTQREKERERGGGGKHGKSKKAQGEKEREREVERESWPGRHREAGRTAIQQSCYYPEGCAAPSFVPCQCNTRECLSKLKATSPQRKIDVTSKSPVGDISVVTLIRTDTTLDHSQKAEKVCS